MPKVEEILDLDMISSFGVHYETLGPSKRAFSNNNVKAPHQIQAESLEDNSPSTVEWFGAISVVFAYRILV